MTSGQPFERRWDLLFLFPLVTPSTERIPVGSGRMLSLIYMYIHIYIGVWPVTLSEVDDWKEFCSFHLVKGILYAVNWVVYALNLFVFSHKVDTEPHLILWLWFWDQLDLAGYSCHRVFDAIVVLKLLRLSSQGIWIRTRIFSHLLGMELIIRVCKAPQELPKSFLIFFIIIIIYLYIYIYIYLYIYIYIYILLRILFQDLLYILISLVLFIPLFW